MSAIDSLMTSITQLPIIERLGEIEQFTGRIIRANGPANAFVGEICEILSSNNQVIMRAQVVGFEKNSVFLMPFGHIQGISQGCKIRAGAKHLTIPIGDESLGRVLNAFAEPLDNLGPLVCKSKVNLKSEPVNPLLRENISQILETRIHCIDSLLPLGLGQRIGIFAGSGVGKSMLLGMIAKNMSADINVIALVGERGREVKEFIENILGEDGLKKSIVIVASSDEPALMRKQAVYTATAIAEYFCEQGKNVVLMMDSITRFAMAQREISLALGEPPTARGYTPSVFSLLPNIVERAGNFSNKGSISAFYTVLVEGDDFNEPIADSMRSLLDGHIVLTRKLAHQGHYPAIDVLQSISRLSTQLLDKKELSLSKAVLATINCYERSRDLIEVGAYKPGVNLGLDNAISKISAINQVLCQDIDEGLERAQVMEKLSAIMEKSHES